jgi:tetratricopeptide (TPR) repeat protein
LIICVLAACFYLPSVSIKEFFTGSAQRAISQPADVRLSPLLIHNILQAQWKPPSPFFYVLFLACLALGFGAAFQKQRRAAGLSFLWVAVPYLIFILIRPRDVNVLSADRYFIFILPVLLLFMAKGITAFGALWSTLAFPFKLPKAVKPVRQNVFQAAALILIAAGLGSSFKDYYLDHWRLGSLRLDNDVAALLKKEVRRDAVIYFDAWPASSLNTMINPLTQDLKPEEFELMSREGFIAKTPENDFIIFRVGRLFYQEYVAGRGIDLWAVAALDAGSASRIIGEAKNRPGIEVRALNGHVVLHLHNDDERVAQKMLNLARLFLSLPLEERRAQQYRLMAAKAELMVYGPEEAYQDIQAYKSATIPSDELKTIPSSPVFRFLDRIFGLSPAALYGSTESKALAEIERLLFVGGNGFLRQNDFDNALKAYLESLSLGKDFSLRISDKLAVLAEKRTGQGKFAEARALFEKAVDLNPGKEDFRICLAEAYRQEGAAGLAEQEYKKVFGLASLPPHFLEQLSSHPQSIIVWESAGLWHLMFRAEEDTAIFGTMAAPKISAIKKTGFDIHDSLRISQNGLQFAVAAKKGAVKILSFKTAKNSRPKFDVKINGRRETGNVIVIN